MNENIRTIINPDDPEEMPRMTQDIKSTDKSSQHQNTGVSNAMFGWMFAAPGDSAPGKSEDQKAKERDEELKRETFMSSTLRSIRNKFVDRQLAGRIVLSSTVSSLVTTAYYLTVSEGESLSYVDGNNPNSEKPEDIQKLTAEENRALTMTDTILNSLERRSLAWEGIKFADNLLLARGASFGMTVPVFTFLTFELSIELCATVKTLLASQKRYEKRLLRDAKRDQFVSKYTPYAHTPTPSRGVSSSGSGDEVTDSYGTKAKESREVEMHEHRTGVDDSLPSIDLFGWGKAIANFVAPPAPVHSASHHAPPVRIAPTVIDKIAVDPSKPVVPMSFPHEPPGTLVVPPEDVTSIRSPLINAPYVVGRDPSEPTSDRDPLGATHRFNEKQNESTVITPVPLTSAVNIKKPIPPPLVPEKPKFRDLDDIDLYG